MENSKIKITPLGAGSEVGRSCILCEFDNTRILFDSGIHPAYSGMSTLPFFDLTDLSKVDAIFVTHFHLDHAASLPYLTEKTTFKGRVFMTHPTKAIMKFLLSDYIRIINSSSNDDLYTEDDLKKCYGRIEAIDYHQEVDVNGLRVSGYNAGHVLGAAMFLVQMGKTRLLYTGDFSREEDRHLKAAEMPGRIDILITESTYGVQCHLSRQEREQRFIGSVSSIIRRGGNALLPVFALGRAQELLLILEEHWEAEKNLQRVPVYYASLLAQRCIGIYRAYINTMNDRIKEIAKTRNPFDFKHIQCLEDEKSFLEGQKGKDARSCVMIASPGMLQSGLSRVLFDLWCTDKRNGIVVTGYVVKGTLARELQSEPAQIETLEGLKKPLKMSIDFISFSAHVDYPQNSSFISESQARHIFLVHGESNEMGRLKNALERTFRENREQKTVYTLKNGETETIEVEKENKVDLVNVDEEGGALEGIFVARGENRILGAERFRRETGLAFLSVRNELRLGFHHTKAVVKSIIYSEYRIRETGHADVFYASEIRISIFDTYLRMEWEGNYQLDVVAYSISELLKKSEEIFLNLKLDRGLKLLKVLQNYFKVEVVDGGKNIFRVCRRADFVLIRDFSIIEYKGDELRERVLSLLDRVESIL